MLVATRVDSGDIERITLQHGAKGGLFSKSSCAHIYIALFIQPALFKKPFFALVRRSLLDDHFAAFAISCEGLRERKFEYFNELSKSTYTFFIYLCHI